MVATDTAHVVQYDANMSPMSNPVLWSREIVELCYAVKSDSVDVVLWD